MKADPIVALYRGWDAYEKSLGQYGAYIVDFDLAPGQYGDSFSSRWQVLNRLTEYRDALSDHNAQDVFLKSKLHASIHYLRAVMGENIPFTEYIQNLMGITPRLFSEVHIDQIRQDIDELLSKWGLKYDREYLVKFYTRFGIENLRTFREDVEKQVDFWYKRIKQHIEVPAMPKVHMHFVNKGEFWHTWLSGFAPEGTTLEINTNPDLKYQFLHSEPVRLATHEICGHALHMAVLFDRIEKGELSPAHGIILVHGPDIVQIEGLGQMLPEIIADIETEFDDLARVARKIYTHRFCVLNNAYIGLSEGQPIQKVYEYVIQRLRFYSIEYVEKELRLWSRDPSMRAYRYIQAISEDLFRKVVYKLPVEQRYKFLHEMYTNPMTPTQIEDWAASISA